MNTKSYDRITERIVALMEQGTVPWHKPWHITTGLPRNLVTKKPYRGINTFLLMAMGYESPNWLTFRQSVQLGGNVKKGEKSCPVVFWKRLQVEDKQSGEPHRIPLLRLYHVFHVTQCDGLEATPEEAPMTLTKPAEIVAGMPSPPAIKHGMTRAYYSPAEDCVGMPAHERFTISDSYHATALFTNWSIRPAMRSRLKRSKSVTEHNRLRFRSILQRGIGCRTWRRVSVRPCRNC